MNWFDIILLSILAFFIIKGLIRGIILETFTLIGFFAAYVIAIREMEWAAAFFARLIDMPAFVATTLGFLIIFIVVVVLFRVTAFLLHKIFKRTPVAALDRGGGVFVGLIKGLLAASMVAYLMDIIPPETGEIMKTREKSWLIKPAKTVAPFLFDLIKDALPHTKRFSDEYQEAMTKAMNEAKQNLVDKAQKSIEEQINGQMNEQLNEQLKKHLKSD